MKRLPGWSLSPQAFQRISTKHQSLSFRAIHFVSCGYFFLQIPSYCVVKKKTAHIAFSHVRSGSSGLSRYCLSSAAIASRILSNKRGPFSSHLLPLRSLPILSCPPPAPSPPHPPRSVPAARSDDDGGVLVKVGCDISLSCVQSEQYQTIIFGMKLKYISLNTS